MSRVKTILVAVGLLAVTALVVGLLLVVALWLLLDDESFLGEVEEARFATTDEWPAADGFSDQFQLTLPPSTRDIHIASSGFQEPVYHLRFTVDPVDVGAVAASPGCGRLLRQEASRRPEALIGDLDWWQVADATVYQACEGPADPGRAQTVVVDTTDETAAIVYVLVIYF